jgi:hypothetical protein
MSLVRQNTMKPSVIHTIGNEISQNKAIEEAKKRAANRAALRAFQAETSHPLSHAIGALKSNFGGRRKRKTHRKRKTLRKTHRKHKQ